MSTYKRKGNDDRFFTYLLVGFGGVIVALIIGLLVYNIINREYDYDEFQRIGSFQAVNDMEEDQYLVYFYGEYCNHCQDIKQQVLKFANKNDAEITVYLMESGSTTGINNIVSPITDKPMNGTPSMIVVIDGIIVDIAVGADDIPTLLNDIDEGTYELIE